ncbi:MAG TPA: APC family permease [Bacillota bacterium]|jgi:amino acid transporter
MPQERLVFMRKASGLVRELSVTDVVIWCIASPTASGLLYYQVSNANSYPGANPILTFLIGGIILFPLVYTLATMMRIMPRSGGMYVTISRLIDPSVAYVTNVIYAVSMGMTVGIMCWVGTGVLGSALALAGHVAKIDGLINVGEWVNANLGHTIISLAVVLLFWWAALVSLRLVKNLMRWSFWLAVIGTVMLVIPGILYSNGQPGFDRIWGSGVYQKVIAAATANGWTAPAFSWSSTIALLLVVFWAYSAFEYIAAMSGEVKSPQKSMFTGIIGGFLLTMVMYMVVSWAVWRPFNIGAFIPAYSFLYDKFPDVLGAIMPVMRPSVPLLLGSLLPNPWLAVAAMVLVTLWFYNTALPSLVAGARILFAMSFDRQIPAGFATVNKRGVPALATHVQSIIAFLTVFLNLAGISVLLGMADVASYFTFWAFGLSAVMLPYKRPAIYALSPVKGDFLGIPVLTWLGGLSVGIGWFLVAFAVTGMSTAAQVAFCATIFVLTMVYVYAQAKNARDGIDLNAIYGEIPPE